MQNAFAAITVPSNSTPGAPVVALNLGLAKSINYEGSQGDDIEFQVSADGGTNYGVADGMRRVAPAAGDFVIETGLWFTHIRAVWKGGTGGGTCGITATPQGTNVPYAAITVPTVLNTPEAYADCRRIGRGRTLVFTGTAGDKFFIEGSDNGSTHPVPIGTWTIPVGKSSFVITIANLANYLRCTRLKGTTAASAAVAGEPVESAGAVNLQMLSVANTAADGFMGGLTAAQSVDVYSAFGITQTTADVDLTLRDPTDATAGKVVYVASLAASTQPATMYGATIRPGTLAAFVWTGAAWTSQKTLVVGGNVVEGAGSLTFGSANGAIRVVSGGVVFLGDTGGAAGTGVATIGRGLTDGQLDVGQGRVTISGSQIDTVVAIGNGTGTLGAAAATVDLATTLEVSQTGAVTAYADMRTLPPPTNPAPHGRRVRVVNVGTAVFPTGDETLKQGVNLSPGMGCEFEWQGTAWITVNEPQQDWIQAGTANATGNVPRLGRRTQYKVTSLAGSIVLTATLINNPREGDVIRLTRTDTAAETVTANNNAAAAQFVMVASKKNFTDLRYSGSDWELSAGGMS